MKIMNKNLYFKKIRRKLILQEREIKDELILESSDTFVYDYKLNYKKIILKNSNINYFYLPNEEYEHDIEFVLENSNINFNLVDFTHYNSKLNLKIFLNTNDSKANHDSVCLASNDNVKNFNIETISNAKNCISNIKCFAIAKDSSHITCNMISTVNFNAKNSKANQDSKILLMDELASGSSNPILKILENDIEASHASSIGKIDENYLFYLTSRGIDLEKAKKMIFRGNMSYMFDRIKDNKIRKNIIYDFEREEL